MFLETSRLIIRDFTETDADALLNLKYDEKVMEFDPAFVKRDADLQDVKEAISFFMSVKDTGNFKREVYFVIELKEMRSVIGVITVSELEYLYEMQIGWMLRSEHSRRGYASEAGAAVSDYLLDTFGYEYLSVVLSSDNIASFKTALKCGFKLFEKRIPYDYFYCKCNHENFEEVSMHFKEKEKEIWSSYFYFRKFNSKTKITSQFYGDTKYNGRFS